ncbi:MAG: AtpZ/AtpI family protein [Alphaproteobacteria bacterium]|nr:AtpZ/AtpI family protein [Alphaproteobacteria bacterium]
MTEPRKGKERSGSPQSELGDLSERLKDLSGRIAAERSEQAESAKPSASLQGATGYAKGYRLASEFVAGTLVGGLFGYGVDWLFGTLPFGLIVFLLLGFGAGILNMARAANRIPPAQERLGSNRPPQAVTDDEEED